MNKKVISKQYSLKKRDIIRGLIMAILTPALLIIQQSVEAGSFTFDWHQVAMASVAGGLAYLLKNFLEPSKTIEKL